MLYFIVHVIGQVNRKMSSKTGGEKRKAREIGAFSIISFKVKVDEVGRVLVGDLKGKRLLGRPRM
jgi:hypothetical protein